MAAEVLTLKSLRDRIDNLIKNGYGDNEIRVDKFNFSLVDSVLERMIIREKILRDKAIEESDERLTSMCENRILFLREIKEEIRMISEV